MSLIFAVRDHPWVDSADGAAVRIAMTVGVQGDLGGLLSKVTKEIPTDGDGSDVTLKSSRGKINADLTLGANVTATRPLLSNSDLSNTGVIPHGSGMLLTETQAQELGLGKNKEIEKHIKPYRNGRDLVATPRMLMVIDLFGFETADSVMQKFPILYQWLLEQVKPDRDLNRDKDLREKWWLHRRNNFEMRRSLEGLPRYIATVMTAKHRIFQYLNADIMPDQKLVSIALDNDFYLGVLSSRIHAIWSIRTGGALGVGNDSVYVKTKSFEAYAFPRAAKGQEQKICNLADRIDAHRKNQQAAHPKLTLTNMYNVLEKLRHEEPLTEKEKEVHQQGLLAILKELHDDLDRAVFNAYGWNDLAEKLVGKPGATTPLPDKTEEQAEAEEELLSRLVALNSERVAEEAKGKIRWLRPEFQSPDAGAEADEAILGDQLQIAAKTTTAETAGKLIWPKVMQDQVRAVREQLAVAPMPIEGLAGQFKRKPIKGVQPVVDALESLGVISLEAGLYRLV